MIRRLHHGTESMRKRKLMRALFLFLSSIAITCCVQAQTYYVAKTGSDSNSGSASAPWLTIGHAALEAHAGATVYVEAGTYKESVTFANSGTASAPIVFNGEGVAIVDGTGVS